MAKSELRPGYILGFIYSHFAPPLVFALVDKAMGTRLAIVATTLVLVLEILVRYLRGQSATKTFRYVGGLIVLLGSVNLILQNEVIFKLDAAVFNFLLGILILWSGKTPINVYYEISTPGRDITQPPPPGEAGYFKFVNTLFGAHFFIRTVFYIWASTQFSAGAMVTLRAILGNALAILFVLVERISRKQALPYFNSRKGGPP